MEIQKLRNENLKLIEELEKLKTSSSQIGSNLADGSAGDESSDNSIGENHEIGRLKEEKSQLMVNVNIIMIFLGVCRGFFGVRGSKNDFFY